MTTRRAVIHLPVTYTLAPGASEALFLATIAAEAADRIEVIGSAAATVSVGQPVIEEVGADGTQPTATSNADAAGWNEPRTSSPAWGA
jgi:hypothetical protein